MHTGTHEATAPLSCASVSHLACGFRSLGVEVVIIEGRGILYHLLPLWNSDLWPPETNEALYFIGRGE